MPNQLIQKKNKQPLTRASVTQEDFSRIENILEEGFKKADSEEGARALTKLKGEYNGLKSLLVVGRLEDTVLNLDRITKLTSGLYQRGLNFLAQALNVAKQLSTSSQEDLLRESEELREDLDKSKPGSTLYNMVTERLSSNAKSLSILKSYSEKLDEYICQAGLCKDSIREIRLEIPELLDKKPKDELDKILLELRTRVEYAQRVQAEYDRQGI